MQSIKRADFLLTSCLYKRRGRPFITLLPTSQAATCPLGFYACMPPFAQKLPKDKVRHDVFFFSSQTSLAIVSSLDPGALAGTIVIFFLS